MNIKIHHQKYFQIIIPAERTHTDTRWGGRQTGSTTTTLCRRRSFICTYIFLISPPNQTFQSFYLHGVRTLNGTHTSPAYTLVPQWTPGDTNTSCHMGSLFPGKHLTGWQTPVWCQISCDGQTKTSCRVCMVIYIMILFCIIMGAQTVLLLCIPVLYSCTFSLLLIFMKDLIFYINAGVCSQIINCFSADFSIIKTCFKSNLNELFLSVGKRFSLLSVWIKDNELYELLHPHLSTYFLSVIWNKETSRWLDAGAWSATHHNLRHRLNELNVHSQASELKGICTLCTVLLFCCLFLCL